MNYFRVYGLADYARSQYRAIEQREQETEGKGVCIECGTCMESLGGAPVFIQTGKSEFPQLDHWEQVGEEEAQIAYEMTLRN